MEKKEIKDAVENTKNDIGDVRKKINSVIDYLKEREKNVKYIDKKLIKEIYNDLIDLDERIGDIEFNFVQVVEWLRSIEDKIYVLFKVVSGEPFDRQVRDYLRKYEQEIMSEDDDEMYEE